MTASRWTSIVTRSERAAWRVDEILPAEAPLDLGRRLLPEALAQVESLASLSADERTRLNQIRGNSYVHLFNFLEDTVIASVMRHAHAAMFGDLAELRALLRFAEEEAKHQELFRRFRASFDRAFPAPARLVESAQEVAGFVLDRSPVAAMLVNYHFELITQQHFVESVRDAREDLEPTFSAMLKHHWQEEAQHAAIDALKLDDLCDGAAPEWLERSLRDYEDVIRAFDEVLGRQASLDVETLGEVAGRPIGDDERASLASAQHRAYRHTFLLTGLRHASVGRVAGQLAPGGAARLDALASALARA